MAREISAGIIIYRRTNEGPKFLLLYHGHNYWNFAKGKIENEEQSYETALREVEEETGLRASELRVKRNFKEYERFSFFRRKEKVFKTVVFYLAETRQPRIRISDEHEGYAWFKYNEAMRLIAKFKDSQMLLKRAYDFLRLEQSKRRAAMPPSVATPPAPAKTEQ